MWSFLVIIVWKYSLSMTSFVSQYNCLTGANEWVLKDEHYDYKQEIARSAFADMLHDSERVMSYKIKSLGIIWKC